MKLKNEIVALVHLNLQKRKPILYKYFVRGNISRIAKHFHTTPYLLKKYCKLLICVGYAKREGDNLIIYSIQHIIHSLDHDDPDRKLLRILRGVYKINSSSTMKGLDLDQVKLKIIAYLIHNNYNQQDWNNRHNSNPLKRAAEIKPRQLKSIEANPIYSSVKMFAKYFKIPLSTMSRLLTKAGQYGYLVKKPCWHEGNLPGCWNVRRKLENGDVMIESLLGIYFKINVY